MENVIKIKLNELLKEQGRSLYGLAQDTGISYTALWKIAGGKVKGITFDVLEKICRSLNCGPNDLLLVSDDEPAAK